MVLKANSLKSVSLKTLEKDPFRVFFLASDVAGSPWCPWLGGASLQPLSPLLHGVPAVSLFLLFIL